MVHKKIYKNHGLIRVVLDNEFYIFHPEVELSLNF